MQHFIFSGHFIKSHIEPIIFQSIWSLFAQLFPFILIFLFFKTQRLNEFTIFLLA